MNTTNGEIYLICKLELGGVSEMAHLPPIERRLSHGKQRAIKTIDKGRTQVFRRELPSNHGLYEEVITGCRRIF